CAPEIAGLAGTAGDTNDAAGRDHKASDDDEPGPGEVVNPPPASAAGGDDLLQIGHHTDAVGGRIGTRPVEAGVAYRGAHGGWRIALAVLDEPALHDEC